MNMHRTLIGQPVHRAEDLRFLTGAGTFVDDLKRDGMLHAVVLRSSVAHGRIRSIDASAARARKGVHAVITAAEIGATMPIDPAAAGEPAGVQSPIFSRSSPRTRCATSASRSRWWSPRPRRWPRTRSKRSTSISSRCRRCRIATRRQATSRCCSKTSGSNRAVRYAVTFGDADAAFAKAEYTRKESFRCHRLTGVPLETRGLIAEWDAAKQSSPFSAPPRCCSSTAARSRPCWASPRQRHRHDRARRRRRLRRARRVLSRGFPDPVRGAATSAVR